MTSCESIMWLRHAAYGVYHIHSLKESKEGGYLYDVVSTIDMQSKNEILQNISEAIECALKCETLNWDKILPNLPHSDHFKRQHLAVTLDRLARRKV